MTIDELIRGVELALVGGDFMDCPAVDADDDMYVTISEIIAALNASLLGCDFVRGR